MRYLVTGAGGFVGSHLTASLRAEGHEVIATGLHEAEGLEPCDVRDPEALERKVLACRPERVFHLAAQSSAARSWIEPAVTYEVNVTGTHNLLDALRRHAPKARVLLACTSDEYGAVSADQCPLDEDAPLRPVSPYAASKVAQEWIGRMFVAAFGMEVVITRAFMHVGPNQPPSFAIAGWARRIARAERGLSEAVVEVGDLDLARELGDVRDVVQAYRAALEFGGAGEAYNVATGEAPSLREALAFLIGRSEVEIEVRVDRSRIRPADPPVLRGSAAKLERLTGWAPKHHFEGTLSEVLDHWRARAAGKRT